MSCDSNSTINAKIEVKNDTFNESAKIEITNIDTPLIKSPIVLSFLRQAKKITTDNRPEMKGLKLAFKIPSSWKEMSTNNPSTAYHFYSKILNADFQLGVSPPSDDDDITEDVRQEMEQRRKSG